MPHTFIIFGASGDLTHRKLVPALYHLFRKGRLPKDTRIVGFSRTAFTHDEWRTDLAKAVARFVGNDFDAGLWDRFSQNIYYHAGDIGRAEDFTELANHGRRRSRRRPPRRILRLGRRRPRHVPKPPAAAPDDHSDGSAGALRSRSGPQRKSEGATGHSPDEARRCLPRHPPWPV